MAKIFILGATGSLGRYVIQQAILANHDVTTLVRTPSKLPTEVREKVIVHQADLQTTPIPHLAAIFRNQDVIINTAGTVTGGQAFVDIVDRIVSGLESLPAGYRPVCWFMAGAALLDMENSGRRGVDIPSINATYWPHLANYDRIRRTTLDWQILCPGPLVNRPPLGLANLRISLDRLPVQTPSIASSLTDALIVPYADAAALMLANITQDGEMSHHRVGLASPTEMRSPEMRCTEKPRTAKPNVG